MASSEVETAAIEWAAARLALCQADAWKDTAAVPAAVSRLSSAEATLAKAVRTTSSPAAGVRG